MRALRESIFICLSNDGSSFLSAGSHMAVEIAGRLSDAHEPREDDDATSGGKERMAGTEHEPIMTDSPHYAHVFRIDDARPLDRVAEGPVGHPQRDRVAAAQGVDVAKRRAVGRPVAGD